MFKLTRLKVLLSALIGAILLFVGINVFYLKGPKFKAGECIRLEYKTQSALYHHLYITYVGNAKIVEDGVEYNNYFYVAYYLGKNGMPEGFSIYSPEFLDSRSVKEQCNPTLTAWLEKLEKKDKNNGNKQD